MSIFGSKTFDFNTEGVETNLVNMLCDPCSSDNVEKLAVIYCQDCSKLFCEDCKKSHAKIKLDRTHSLRGIECVPSQTDRKTLRQLNSCPCCREQNAEPLVYFCKDHDTFCCGTCGFSKHRKCNHVDKIEDVLVDTNGQAFDEPVGALETKIKELTDLATENTQLADKSYNDIEKRLDEVKRAIDEAYDDLKTKVLNSAKTRHQALATEIQQQSQNIESLSMKLNEEKARAETVAKFGTATDMHIFNHYFQKVAFKEMNSSGNKIRSLLIPRQFSSQTKHSIDEIAGKLKEAIEIVDKDLGADCETKLSFLEQASRMRQGSRVVRGRDWPRSWKDDGGAGGKGTVVEMDSRAGAVKVKWDISGYTDWCCMGGNGKYQLQLVD